MVLVVACDAMLSAAGSDSTLVVRLGSWVVSSGASLGLFRLFSCLNCLVSALAVCWFFCKRRESNCQYPSKTPKQSSTAHSHLDYCQRSLLQQLQLFLTRLASGLVSILSQCPRQQQAFIGLSRQPS